MTETTTEVEKPIIVSKSAISTNTLTFIRYLLVAAGGILVSKGYLSDKTLNDIIGLILIIIPTAYGIWQSQKNNDIKVTLADEVPNRIAKVE